MKVLITGGAGFIGRWTVKRLLRDNHDVWAIDNLSNGAVENLSEFESHPHFKGLTIGDIFDATLVNQLFENQFDVCIHLAAQIEVQNSLDNTKKSFDSNMVGTYNLLEACMKTKTKFIFMSTCMVYDTFVSGRDGTGITEKHPVKPASPYAGTKLAGENMALSYYFGFDLPVVILRPFNTYGPFQKTNLEGGVVSIFVKRALEGQDLLVFGDGTQTRDLLYVEDCADFIVKASLDDRAVGQIWNAGLGRDITINELAQTIQPDQSRIKHVEHHHPQAEIQKLVCDYSKSKEVLGWEPTTTLQQGIAKTREWVSEKKTATLESPVSDDSTSETKNHRREKMLPYGMHCIDEEDISAVTDVLRHGWITTGPKIDEFENAICEYTGAKYGVALANGTTALDLAIRAYAFEEGSEIITTPLTFVATSNSVLFNRCKPVFVDIKPDTFNIDPSKIREKITDKTKAIIYVDYAGQPCDFTELRKIADEHNLILIEDAAHAIGAVFKDGVKVGNKADVTTFSFHPVKNMTTGEGGLVTTNDEEIYKRLKLLRNHGLTKEARERFAKESSWRYDQIALGRNYRMTDFQAALGINQLKKLDGFIAMRNKLAHEYHRLFADVDEVMLPTIKDGIVHGWHIFTMLLNSTKYEWLDRDKFFDLMKQKNIGVNVHYIPIYQFSYYKELFAQPGYDLENVNPLNYPVTEAVFNNLITLPLFPTMKLEDVADVVKTVKEVLDEMRPSGSQANEAERIEASTMTEQTNTLHQSLPFIQVGDRKIGVGEKCFFIVEVTLNHNGSMETAKKMIDAAVEAGAECVKFQTFITEDFISDRELEYTYELADGTKVTEKQFDMFKRYELSEDDFKELKRYCEEKGVMFMSTPGGSRKCVEILERVGSDIYKMGSDDLTDYPYLKYIAKKGKPMILSTGYSNADEIRGAVEAIYSTGNTQLILLHCVSAYPTTPDMANLDAMNYLKDTYGVPTGFSDHTPGAAVTLKAVEMGATVIEKHFSLDRYDKGPDHRFSIEPHELKRIMDGIQKLHENPNCLKELLNEEEQKDAETAVGQYHKTFDEKELKMKKAAQKSLTYIKDFTQGHVLEEDDFDMKRANFEGITDARKIADLIGKPLTQDVKKDDLVSPDHL